MKYEFPDVCMVISGNSSTKIDVTSYVYISRWVIRSKVHRKTAFCIDFVLFWMDFW